MPATKMDISELSHAPRSLLKIQLDKIDPSVIQNGTLSSHQPAFYADIMVDNVFEGSLLAFRDIIINRLWRTEKTFESETEFCTRQWRIERVRKTRLMEYADVLWSLKACKSSDNTDQFPVRPRSEDVCALMVEASLSFQQRTLHAQSLVPELWAKVLEEWRQLLGNNNNLADHGTVTREFANQVLTRIYQQQQLEQQQRQFLQHQQQQQQQQQQHRSLHAQQHASTSSTHNFGLPPLIPTSSVPPAFARSVYVPNTMPSLASIQTTSLCATTTSASTSNSFPPAVIGIKDDAMLPPSAPSAIDQSNDYSRGDRVGRDGQYDLISRLLNDPRRFQAPIPVLDRIKMFFNNVPYVDLAHFEGSILNAPLKVSFPDFYHHDSLSDILRERDNQLPLSQVPVFGSKQQQRQPVSQRLRPGIQSCFLHVPTLPTKRTHETDSEIVLIDDVRLIDHMNFRLWDEFSNKNIQEAITLVPASSSWFRRSELAKWPCVVMTGLRFEQLIGPSSTATKRYYEHHSYMVIYLGRDPLRQVQFVKAFQDLSILPSSNSVILPGLAAAAAAVEASSVSSHSGSPLTQTMDDSSDDSGIGQAESLSGMPLDSQEHHPSSRHYDHQTSLCLRKQGAANRSQQQRWLGGDRKMFGEPQLQSCSDGDPMTTGAAIMPSLPPSSSLPTPSPLTFVILEDSTDITNSNVALDKSTMFGYRSLADNTAAFSATNSSSSQCHPSASFASSLTVSPNAPPLVMENTPPVEEDGEGTVDGNDEDTQSDYNSVDPVLDDKYSLRPAKKKPRLERSGRPSDVQASAHHIKRRKVNAIAGRGQFSKIGESNSDAEMSE